MYDSDSEASEGSSATDGAQAYDHSFVADGLETEDERRRPRSENDYERAFHKFESRLTSVDGKTTILVDGQKKGHEKLDSIATQQNQDSQTLSSVKAGMDQLLERQAENNPTYKAQLEKEKAKCRKEIAMRLRAEKRAESLEDLLERTEKAKAQRNRKPSKPVLSDQTNAEKEAEANHQARLQPKAQKEAAIKRSKRGRTLFGGEGF